MGGVASAFLALLAPWSAALVTVLTAAAVLSCLLTDKRVNPFSDLLEPLRRLVLSGDTVSLTGFHDPQILGRKSLFSSCPDGVGNSQRAPSECLLLKRVPCPSPQPSQPE